MPAFPVQSTIGDPIFRAQGSSIDAVRRFSRIAADSAIKLNNQERIVSPGDDALSFSTSRRIRSTINALETVQETGQLNITGLSLAIDAIDGIKVQLDSVKKTLVQAQVADASERAGLQAEIDLAISQIDSAAQNTKLGARSLLDGSSTIKAFSSIAGNGAITDYGLYENGESLTQTSGVQQVRVNKVGVGGPVRLLNDGSAILSLRVSLLSSSKADRPVLSFSANGAAAAGDFIEYRITGKLGSATLRLNSTAVTLANMGASVDAFNRLAQETGVVITSLGGGNAGLTTVGYGDDEFIKVEMTNRTGSSVDLSVQGTAASALTADGQIGEAMTEYGRAAEVRVNGRTVTLGGDWGTTARYMEAGFDLEIDFGTNELSAFGGTDATSVSNNVNIRLTDGVVGLLGATGDTRDVVQYGFREMTSEMLGRGNGMYAVTVASTGDVLGAGANPLTDGNEIIDQFAIADLGSGGRLALEVGDFRNAIRTIDRAVEQSISEQTRLGVLQGNFIDAVQRSEVLVGNLTSADADIIGVDAATEISNLVQAQLGVANATSILGQANQMQQTVFQLLR